jgi:hypothetical protein
MAKIRQQCANNSTEKYGILGIFGLKDAAGTPREGTRTPGWAYVQNYL